MIDWVHSTCGQWGVVMRNRQFDSGFPPDSTIHQLLSGRSGFRQHFAEVMMPADLLVCDRAIRSMEGTDLHTAHRVLWGYYVFRFGQRAIGNVLNLRHYEVRQQLDTAHGWLAAKIERAPEPHPLTLHA